MQPGAGVGIVLCKVPLQIPPRAVYLQQAVQCGKPSCHCMQGGAMHGPYWYAYWWEGGRCRSRYVGKHLPKERPMQPERTPLPSAHSEPTTDTVLRTIRNARRTTMGGLAFVPEVVRTSGLPVDEVHKALVTLERKGAVELRPESGMGRLSQDELRLSVAGPALPGMAPVRLSWVRML